MTEADMLKIQQWVHQGATLLIGSDAAGRKKLKISHGPLGLITHRFPVTDAEVRKLKSMVAKGAEVAPRHRPAPFAARRAG